MYPVPRAELASAGASSFKRSLPSIVPYCPLYSNKNAFIIMADSLELSSDGG